MSLNSILIPFFGADDSAALRTALSLTNKFQGHLEALFVTPDLGDTILHYSKGYLWPSSYPESLMTDFFTEAKRKEEAARGLFTRIAEDMQIDIADDGENADYPSAKFLSLEGDPAEIFIRRSFLSDLIVINRQFGKTDRSFRMVQTALFRTGRPVLLMPVEKLKRPLLDKVVIAWNGSFEASRAVHLALPLLKGSKVLVFCGIEGGEPPGVGPEALKTYLAHHGVAAEVTSVQLDNERPEEALKRIASEFDAGMVVMGAYSRQDKLREALLGSLTEEILNNAELPILMAN